MTDALNDLPRYDRTARKTPQWTMVVLVAAGLVIQGVAGGLLIALAGLIMLVGRFWWPADLVRQLVWQALEPAGFLKRDDVHEDHETRRGAGVIGGGGLASGAGPPPSPDPPPASGLRGPSRGVGAPAAGP